MQVVCPRRGVGSSKSSGNLAGGIKDLLYRMANCYISAVTTCIVPTVWDEPELYDRECQLGGRLERP